MRFDVVIVGAGIGGAVLALALGRRGWSVALVERESAPLVLARPEILWGATPRVLEPFGIAEAIRETASVHVEAIEIGGEKPWVKITHHDFAAAGVEAYSTNPSLTRALIADAALATGNVEIHRGVAVDDLLSDNGRTVGVRGRRGEATVEMAASLVVGDDGGHSVVRTRLGIPITFANFPIEFVTALIPRWPLAPDRARVWIRTKASNDELPVAAFIPWPGNEGILLVPLPADRAQRLFDQPSESFWRSLDRVTPLASSLREQLEYPTAFKRVARPFGHATAYVAHGAALIGDAVHPMTPAGGQGANASIWDALALADVADAALRSGDVSLQSLVPYERLRRPVNEKSISFSRGARRALRFGAFLPPTSLVPLLARMINGMGWPKRKVIGAFATAFVHPQS
jgi:monooxygenase